MKHVSNEQKAREIERKRSMYFNDLQGAALDMAQWKDEQLIERLTAFAIHLQRRGAFRDDLCMDFEHEAQSFIELQKRKGL